MNDSDEMTKNEFSEIHAGLRSSQGLAELFTALSTAQSQMGKLINDKKNEFYGSSYSTLKSVLETVRIPLTNNGLSLTQWIVGSELVTMLAHKSGEWMSASKRIVTKDPNDAHKEGSGITYARRYSAMAVCGIAPEDDDGNKASGKITSKSGDWNSNFGDAVRKLMESKSKPHLENLWKKHQGTWKMDLIEMDMLSLVLIKDQLKEKFSHPSFIESIKGEKISLEYTATEKPEKT